MTNLERISVIIPTYNRSRVLPDAIRSLLDQSAPANDYEVIVVDNNSTDDTRKVVDTFIAAGASNLRYVFEGQQGVSSARNAGIKIARGSILAFMDDDVRADREWIATINAAFQNDPEASFIGGKVLPQWTQAPPTWLTQQHWSPLALLDYGDSKFHLIPKKELGVISANLAVRREVVEEVGTFSTELQFNENHIASVEDHELVLRIWAAGKRGLYVPDLKVNCPVPVERMTKSYHRRWHRGHGHFYAKLRDDHMESGNASLLGVPSHLYKQAAIDSVLYIRYLISGNGREATFHANRVCFFLGFTRKRVADFNATRHHSFLHELMQCIHSLADRNRSRTKFKPN